MHVFVLWLEATQQLARAHRIEYKKKQFQKNLFSCHSGFNQVALGVSDKSERWETKTQNRDKLVIHCGKDGNHLPMQQPKKRLTRPSAPVVSRPHDSQSQQSEQQRADTKMTTTKKER